ncbi:hypothetical protein IRJ41_017725, partial [Triplophysa rosa]
RTRIRLSFGREGGERVQNSNTSVCVWPNKARRSETSKQRDILYDTSKSDQAGSAKTGEATHGSPREH